jgi:hypothetical protein
MTTEDHISFMRKHLSARGNLFLFVRSHQYWEYYFDLHDARVAANQADSGNALGCAQGAKVVEMHPIARVQVRHRR